MPSISHIEFKDDPVQVKYYVRVEHTSLPYDFIAAMIDDPNDSSSGRKSDNRVETSESSLSPSANKNVMLSLLGI